MNFVELLSTNGLNLEFMETQTPEMCRVAVMQNGAAIRYVKKQTEELCELAVANNWWTIRRCKYQTPRVCAIAVKQNEMALIYVHNQTREICIASLYANEYSADYMDDEKLKAILNNINKKEEERMEIEYEEFEVSKEQVKGLGRDTPLYCTVEINDMKFIRAKSTLEYTEKGTVKFKIPKQDASGKEYKITLIGPVTVEGKTEKDVTEFDVTVSQLKEMFGQEPEEKKSEFIAIKISKRRFAGEPWKTERMSEPYQKIYVGTKYSYNRPLRQLHEIKNDPENVMVYLPKKTKDGEDYVIHTTYTEKQADGTFKNERIDVTSEMLAKLHEMERNQAAFNKEMSPEYTEIVVSKRQVVGEPWQGNDGEERRTVLAPNGYTFSRKISQLHEIDGDDTHYHIFFPKTYQSGDEYTVVLAKSIKGEDGCYHKETKEITPDALAAEYEESRTKFLETKEERKFTEIIVSEDQLVGKEIPLKNTPGEFLRTIMATDGYTYVRKVSQIHPMEDMPGYYSLKIPEKNKEGEVYTIALEKSVPTPDGSYEKIIKRVTGEELNRAYEEERKVYKRGRGGR